VKSLFLKIFLSFWLAQALFLVLAILTTLALRPSRDVMGVEESRRRIADEAATAFSQGGERAVREYIENLENAQHVRLFLFNAQGNEVSGRVPPLWATEMARSGHVRYRAWIDKLMPQRFFFERAATASGERYLLLMELPPGPRVFFGPHGVPGLGLMIAILSSGLVCYFLSRYLTSPIVRLRAATQQLAAGDLTARAGAVPKSRRDELSQLVRDFDTMAERLENLVNAQSRLLKDISHELRSPLARLNVALALARRKTGLEAESSLARIELEAERLNELIGRLLTVARIEGGEDSIRMSIVNLEDLIREVARDADFEAQGRNCHVKCLVDLNVLVSGNPALLHSAIENVVRNATRYTREGSEVEVSLARAEDGPQPQAVIRVLDSGPGVPDEVLGDLFRPFYRLDDARNRETGGVGLGLAITERAVRLHGGTVEASNRPEGGLSVEIRLPLAMPSLTNEDGSVVPGGAKTSS
jgi:two-component system sensor histidine kinase CpxA